MCKEGNPDIIQKLLEEHEGNEKELKTLDLILSGED